MMNCKKIATTRTKKGYQGTGKKAIRVLERGYHRTEENSCMESQHWHIHKENGRMHTGLQKGVRQEVEIYRPMSSLIMMDKICEHQLFDQTTDY